MLNFLKRIFNNELANSTKTTDSHADTNQSFFSLHGIDFNNFTDHVLDNMTELVWAKDLEGRYIYSNKVHNESFLFTTHSQEAIGKDHKWFAERQRKEAPERDDWHTFDLGCSDSDKQIIDTGVSARFIESGYIKGKKITLDVYKSPIRNSKDEIIGVIGSGRDISHQASIEEELASSRIQNEAILSAIPDMMYLFDYDGNFTTIHSGNHDKSDSPFADQSVRNIKDRFDKEFAIDTLNKIRLCLKEGTPFTTKYKLTTQKETFHYEARHVRLSQDKVLAISRDITDSLIHEKSSKQRQRLMKAINLANSELLINQELDSSIPKAFEIIGINSDIDLIQYFQANDRKIDSYDYSLHSFWRKEPEFPLITNKDLKTFNLLGDSENDFFRVKRGHINQEKSTVYNDRLHPKLMGMGINSYAIIPVKSGIKENGVLVFANCRSSAPFDEATLDALSTLAVSIGGASTRFETETHLKQVLKKVEASNLLKNNLLRNISHELRTPLNGIQGFSDLLASENLDSYTMDLVRQIKKASKRFTSTLHNLMMLSQLEDESECPKPKPVSIELLVSQLITELEESIAKNNNEILVDIRVHESITLSEPYLTQILTHLLDNAVKFTQNGTIKVSAFVNENANGNNLQIEIADSGIGIEQEFLDIIFEPFRQVSEGTTRNYEGSGIGLTIAKKLTSSLNAELSVKSQIGIGTTFTLTIPLNGTMINAQPSQSKHIEKKESSKKPTILVVEDNIVNANLVKLYLEELCEIVIVRSYNESIQVLSNLSFDAILLDIHLGNGPDGLEIVRELKKKPLEKEIPIIAVSGFDTMADKIRCNNEGINYYLTKPFSKRQIIQILYSLQVIQ